MITREEYLNAIQLIYDYRDQFCKEVDDLKLINPEDYVHDHLDMSIINNLCIYSGCDNEYGFNLTRHTKVKDFKIDVPLKEIRRIRGIGNRSIEQLIEFCTKINIKLK